MTIVFLHGTRLTGAQWAVQCAALGGEFRTLSPDLPGHGSAEDTPFRLADAAERVAQLIETEADSRAILVGLSLGGYVAMEVAARWPERVTGLAISGATAEPVGLRSLGYRLLAWIFGSLPEPLLDAVNRWFFGWRFPPEVGGPILAAGFSFRGGSVAVRSLIGERFRPRLARYPGPCLLINGEFDLFFRPWERAFAEVAADPRRVLVRRATHLANLDQPEVFTAIVQRFARRITAAGVGGPQPD